MKPKVGIRIEMVDASGQVLWSERTIEADKGHVIRYGPVNVKYELSPGGDGGFPHVQVVAGTFTGYLKVTVEDVEAGAGADH